MLATTPPYWWVIVLGLSAAVSGLAAFIAALYRGNDQRSDERIGKMEEREEKFFSVFADSIKEMVKTQQAILDLVKDLARQGQEEYIVREVEKRLNEQKLRGRAP